MNVTGITSHPGLTASDIRPNPNVLTPAERAHASHLRGAALRNASAAEQRAAVASQFEAILLRQMLGKTMTSMLGKDSGAAGSIYGDLLTDTISDKLSSGSGMGIARLLEQQLAPRAPVNPTSSVK